MRSLLIVAVALAALLAPIASAEDCQPLKRYGTIPFEPDENAHVYLPASVNGFQTHFMLDTGAYWSIIRGDIAKHLNLTIKKSYAVIMHDASGALIDTLTVVPDFKLGKMAFGAAEFFIGGLDENTPMEGNAGVVGQNLFTQVDIDLDNAGHKFSLFSQDHCPGDGVYWSDEAVILSYKRDRSSQNQTTSRIRKSVDKNQIDEPVVSAELQGKPVTVLFDTGATFTSIDLDHARNVFGIGPGSPGVEPASKVYVGSGAQVQTYRYVFKELTISGIRFENVPVLLGDFGDLAQVILGMHEMKQLHIYFAFKEGKIYVTAANAGMKPARP